MPVTVTCMGNAGYANGNLSSRSTCAAWTDSPSGQTDNQTELVAKHLYLKCSGKCVDKHCAQSLMHLHLEAAQEPIAEQVAVCP